MRSSQVRTISRRKAVARAMKLMRFLVMVLRFLADFGGMR
jgi:hypothetical protein